MVLQLGTASNTILCASHAATDFQNDNTLEAYAIYITVCGTAKNDKDWEEEPCVVVVKEHDCNCLENLKHQLAMASLKLELEEHFNNLPFDEEDL
jgi:hypothetical protein